MRGNNIRVDGIEEDENETWENTENKLRSFLYDKLEITDGLYIERTHRVRRREGVKFNSNNTPRTIISVNQYLRHNLGYKQKMQE